MSLPILQVPPIQALASAASLDGSAAPGVAQSAGQKGFGELVSSALGVVNDKLAASQVDMQQLAVGDVQNLHQIMIRLEESRLSFQLLMQVRNRVLEAYQDIMKMQV